MTYMINSRKLPTIFSEKTIIYKRRVASTPGTKITTQAERHLKKKVIFKSIGLFCDDYPTVQQRPDAVFKTLISSNLF